MDGRFEQQHTDTSVSSASDERGSSQDRLKKTEQKYGRMLMYTHMKRSRDCVDSGESELTMTETVCTPSSSLFSSLLSSLDMFDQLPDIIPLSLFHSVLLGPLTRGLQPGVNHAVPCARAELLQPAFQR